MSGAVPRALVVTTALIVSSAAWPHVDRVDLSATPQVTARPQGWDARTHGDGAPADYARLFTLDRVHEVQIVMSADNFRRMQEDLGEVVPAAGFMGRGRFGAPAAPPNAMPPPPRGSTALPEGGLLGRGWSLTTRDPEYVPVTVQHNGRVWTEVGMRFKGSFSLMMAAIMGSGKISFRLNFDRFEDAHREIANQRFYGFKELTFSSNFGDDSQLREALANELFRDRGVAAPRVAFYRVTVDAGIGPVYWGLYTMVEDPADEAMLRSQFGTASGNLYKPEGPGADWTRFDAAGFENKTNRLKPDFTDIAGAITALQANGAASPQWRANLEKHLDVDHFLRWLAVNQIVDNWDVYGRYAHNYYLYADPGRGGRLVWIPWDNNFAFGGVPFGAMPFAFGGARPASPAPPAGAERGPIMNASNDDVLQERVGAEWPLISRLLADATYRARYRAHLATALGGLYEPEALRSRVHAWHELIAASVAKEDPSRTTVSSQENFQNSLDGPSGLVASVDRRRSLIKTALAR